MAQVLDFQGVSGWLIQPVVLNWNYTITVTLTITDLQQIQKLQRSALSQKWLRTTELHREEWLDLWIQVVPAN